MLTPSRLQLVLCAALLAASGGRAEDAPSTDKEIQQRDRQIQQILKKELPAIVALYKHVHSHPELSHQEEKTAARLAEEIKKLGFTVTTKVGGHGIVGVLKNGEGPTVMVRADMDALPVQERTGLAYASKNDGVMHACGHDVHVANWVGTARVLTQMKDQWSGTLMFIAQPAEEVGAGARMMLADGLFTRFPRPDFAFCLHVDSQMPYGHVAYREEEFLSNVDTVTIIVHGKGGHGAAPHTTIDPIVIGARIVLDLQTIVSRELKPGEPAVVTVGSFHGGTKANVIPSEAKLELTVRSMSDKTRDQLLKAIERIALAAAQAANAPKPEIKINVHFTPALINNPDLAKKTGQYFRQILGKDNVHIAERRTGGEDFGRYGRAGVPIFYYRMGTVPADRVELAKRRGETLPSLHSGEYYPIPEPTLKTGVRTMSHAVLNVLGKKN